MRGLFIAVSLTLVAAAAEAGPLDVQPNDRVLGRADAPVTVVEYASFTCSHCADWHMNTLPAFKARFIDTGQVKLVFRDLPTPPAQIAATAAAVARCAAPDRFFDVTRALMTGQAAAMEAGNAGPWFQSAVAVSGRTEAQITACVSDPATLAALRAGGQVASELGVQSTPSFFVNGKAVPDRSLEGLSAAITPLID
jgi:protein-disulfide isomerase